MVRLFVTDLDGTLLPKGSTVSEGNIEAVKKATEAGITVSIATGRMFRATLPVARALGVDVPVVTYDGALIKRVSGEVLYESALPPELAVEIIDFAQKEGWYLQSYSGDNLLFAEYDDHSRVYESKQLVKGETTGWDGIRERTDRVYKLLSVAGDPAEADRRVKLINERFAGRAHAVRSMQSNVDIVKEGTSKASGVRALADTLGIPLADTMVIGDSDNDLPMLRVAGHAVAMGNANDSVKAAADFETSTCEEDGFAKAVYDFALGGEEKADGR